MVLLDYPDSEGVTRELVIGSRRRLADRKAVLVATASAVLLLGAVFGGRAVLRPAATGPAPDIHLPLVPFPSVSASGSTPLAAVPSPPLTVSLHGNQLTPSLAPVRNTMSAPSPVQSAAPSPAASSTQQAIAVQYLVVAQADGEYQFEGEVRVVNNGSAPISGWQIAVALPYDRITAIGGASGYVSNHILLLQPDPGSDPLAAGGELRVFFVAEGPETTPKLCAFNDITCG